MSSPSSPTLPLLLMPLLLLLTYNLVAAEICEERVCRYGFVVRFQSTMVYHHPTYGAYNVELNSTQNGYVLVENDAFRRLPDPLIGTSVGLDEVIAADGYPRNIITINEKFPGPNIEVREGAQVVVKIVNKLPENGIAIHWHGLTMRGTPRNDGVPDISHCPIAAGRSFTYRFVAAPAGTHWYHSHVSHQRINGLYGLIMVHPPTSPQGAYHSLTVGDWFKEPGLTHFMLDPYSADPVDRGTGGALYASDDLKQYLSDGVAASGLVWHSGLINGRGRYDQDIPTPLSSFLVTKDQQYYRFKMANVGADYALRVSVDQHPLRVVAADGLELDVPVVVDYINIDVGETFDFEIETNQPVGSYWLRASTLQDRSKSDDVHEVKAIVHYDPTPPDATPTSSPRPCTATNPCIIINCPFSSFPPTFNATCVPKGQVKTRISNEQLEEGFGLKESSVRDIFLNMGFHDVGVTLNGISFVKPTVPPYQEDSEMVDCIKVCTDTTVPCQCTHRYKLRYNETIQLVISNFPKGNTFDHYPFHLHGHYFAVIHVGYPPTDPTTGLPTGLNTDVVCNDDGSVCRNPSWKPGQQQPNFNMSAVVIKNTITVPARGYVVLRFKANNPGYWIGHWHNGMTVMLEEAPEQVKTAPVGFPTCHDYSYSDEEYVKNLGLLDDDRSDGAEAEPGVAMTNSLRVGRGLKSFRDDLQPPGPNGKK